METPKQKADSLVEKYYAITPTTISLKAERFLAIECAKIAVENEYNSLIEQVVRLRPSITGSLYLKLIEGLINEEKEVKTELNKL